MGARNGAQYLEGLSNTRRELWIGETRVEDVASHPDLAGGAQSLAALFDLQHEFAEECLTTDPETGELMNVSHMVPRSKEDLRKRRKGLERIHRFTLGHMGRSPDYNNICFAGFAAHAHIWAGESGENERGAQNLVAFQRHMRQRDISATHVLIHPTIDKSREQQVAGTEHALHKVGETKDSIIVRGGRILATLAPYADELVLWSAHPLRQPQSERYALAFGIPIDTPGLIFIGRDSMARSGSAFDLPISTRFDEQDAFVIFDDVEIPKDRVFIDGQVDIYNAVGSTGFSNVQQQTTVRALTKLQLAYGLGAQMAEIINDRSEATQEMLGEILSYIELTRAALLLAEEHAYDHGKGVFYCDGRPLAPLRGMMPIWIPRAMEILKLIGSHNLLATPNERTLNDERLRPLIERYMTSADGTDARHRASVFRLAWDFIGSGVAGRNELYERFYIGSGRSNRKALHMMQGVSGSTVGDSGSGTDPLSTRDRANDLIASILKRSAFLA